MYDLVNDLPDLPEHSNEIYYTVASGKLKTRVTGKYGLYPYDKWQKELLRAVDGDNFYNVFRACAKSNIKKRVWKKEDHIKAEQQSAQAMWKDWRFMQYFMVVEYVDTEMRNKTNNPYCKFSLEVFKATWSKIKLDWEFQNS